MAFYKGNSKEGKQQSFFQELGEANVTDKKTGSERLCKRLKMTKLVLDLELILRSDSRVHTLHSTASEQNAIHCPYYTYIKT